MLYSDMFRLRKIHHQATFKPYLGVQNKCAHLGFQRAYMGELCFTATCFDFARSIFKLPLNHIYVYKVNVHIWDSKELTWVNYALQRHFSTRKSHHQATFKPYLCVQSKCAQLLCTHKYG